MADPIDDQDDWIDVPAVQAGATEDDWSTVPPGARRTWVDSAKDLGQATWESVGGQTVMDLMGGASRDPAKAQKAKETLSGIGQGIINEPKRVLSELKKAAGTTGPMGAPTGQTLYHLAGAIPMFGAGIQQPIDEARKGEYAKAAGHTLGMLVPYAGKVMPKTVKARLNLFNRATPEVTSSIKYLEDIGGAPNAAAATSSPFVRRIQYSSEATPLGAYVGESAAKQTTDALRKRAGILEERAAPGPSMVPETAGTEVYGGLESRKARFGRKADVEYDSLRAIEADPANTYTVQTGTKQVPTGQVDAAGNPIMATQPVMENIALPVDMRNIKARLRPIYEQFNKAMLEGKRPFSQALHSMKNILDEPDFIPASQADINLGALKGMTRKGEEGLNRGLIKNIIPLYQEIVDDAVMRAGPKALEHLNAGRSFTKGKYRVDRILKKLTDEPVRTFEKLTLDNDAGINFLRKVHKERPAEMAKIGRAYLQDLFKTAMNEGGFKGGAGLHASWHKLGPSTKKLLFPDQKLVAELDKFFQAAKTVAENPNPSGTALVTAAAGTAGLMVTAPFATAPILLGGGALAKLLRSQAGVKLLTEGLEIPVAAPGAGMKGAQLLRLAGMGEEEEEEKRASGGLLGRLPTRAETLQSLMR